MNSKEANNIHHTLDGLKHLGMIDDFVVDWDRNSKPLVHIVPN